MVTEAAHWFGGCEGRTAAAASMACVLWNSCSFFTAFDPMYVSKLTRVRAELAACKGTSKQAGNDHAVVRGAFGSFVVQKEQWDKKLGVKKIHFLRSRSLPRPALLSCPRVTVDAWLSATRCARSRARHTPSPRRSRTAADLAQERRGADDATMGGRATTPSRWGGGGEEVLEG